jgi:hypothetical protein
MKKNIKLICGWLFIGMFLLTFTIGCAVKNYHHSVMRTSNGTLITLTAASETRAL